MPLGLPVSAFEPERDAEDERHEVTVPEKDTVSEGSEARAEAEPATDLDRVRETVTVVVTVGELDAVCERLLVCDGTDGKAVLEREYVGEPERERVMVALLERVRVTVTLTERVRVTVLLTERVRDPLLVPVAAAPVCRDRAANTRIAMRSRMFPRSRASKRGEE